MRSENGPLASGHIAGDSPDKTVTEHAWTMHSARLSAREQQIVFLFILFVAGNQGPRKIDLSGTRNGLKKMSDKRTDNHLD